MSSRGMQSWRVTASEPRGKNTLLTLECGHTKLVGGDRARGVFAFCHQCPSPK